MLGNQELRLDVVAQREKPRPSVSVSRFAAMVTSDQPVEILDPLGADDFFAMELPVINDAGDMRWLANRASHFVPVASDIAAYGTSQARAATRDLGMIAASLQRYKTPFEAVSGLEEAQELGISHHFTEIG